MAADATSTPRSGSARDSTAATEGTREAISVVIATRDRPQLVTTAVESVLASDFESFHLVVADQSTGEPPPLPAFPADSRLQHVPLPSSSGVARARNAAIRASRAPLIAITDDDCAVDREWLTRLEEAFRRDDRIGIVYGNVLPARFDATRGFIPGYSRDRSRIFRTPREKHHSDGLGACMGIRRSCWEALYGFDESFGVGSLLEGASEAELTFRALLAGWWVLEDPGVSVTHLGFRPWAEQRPLVRRYWFGAGASHAKYLRLDGTTGTWLLARAFARWLQGPSRVSATLGRGPHRLARAAAFAAGFRHALFLPIDDATRHFRVAE